MLGESKLPLPRMSPLLVFQYRVVSSKTHKNQSEFSGCISIYLHMHTHMHTKYNQSQRGQILCRERKENLTWRLPSGPSSSRSRNTTEEKLGYWVTVRVKMENSKRAWHIK